MRLRHLRLLAFIIPLGFCLLAFLYKDSFYLLLAGITLIFALFIILPKLLSDKKISFFQNKKHKLESHHSPDSNFSDVLNISTKKQEVIIFILVSTLLFIVIFTYAAAHILQNVPNVKNFILEYYISQFLSLKQTGIFLAVLLVAGAFIGSNLRHTGRNYKLSFKFNRLHFIKYFFLACFTLIFAFVFSFLTTYIYAAVQLNLAVYELKNAPSSVGVIYGKNAINSRLKSMTTVPQVIGSDTNTSNTILSAIVNDTSNKNSYYQDKIIKTLPHSLVMSFSLNNQPVVMVNNTLIINSIDKDTMQTISPTLAHLLLKGYFKSRDLKGNPTISILNRQEYLAFRQDEINKQVAKIQAVIKKVEDYINTLYGDISNAKQKIAANQSAMQSEASNVDYYYNNCINAGYSDYFTGSFFHTYSQSYCDSIKSQASSDIAQFQSNINSWNSTLSYDQNELAQAQTADQNLKDYAQSIDSSKNSTPDELGIFEGPSHVRVVLDSTSPKGIDAFLETLVHENLHYQSYVSQDRNFQFSDGTYDGFWEEGLTEYFARKVVSGDLGVNINQGYPLLVKVVAQIARKIPESELQRIYFTKDEGTLEADLNAAYGTDFYKNTEPYFEYLSYLPEDKQLKYANNIMTVIRGKQLTTNDIYSTDMQSQ